MHAAQRYQQIEASTASPGQLLLALYDGLFRMLRAARVCLENNQRARASEQLSKAYAIVSELYIALDHGAAPDLCGNLASLYEFALDRLTTANVKGSIQAIDEVIRVLTPIHEANKLAVPKAAHEAATKASGK